MQCLKCGREIPVGQVFCDACLEDMKKYPVKPGTAVQLPKRPEAPPVKKQSPRRTPAPSLEEQVKRLKRRVWAACIALVLTLALAGAGVVLTLHFLREEQDEPLPGQNYSSAETEDGEESGGE